MVVLHCLLLWLFPIALATFPDISDLEFIRSCVDVHNKDRSRVSPPASDMQRMTWDEALAKSARAWARRCKASHNPLLEQAGQLHPEFKQVGENVWVGAPASAFSVESAVRSWRDEVHSYTLSNHSCTAVCGHYTQLVWAKSFKVGCAVHICPKGIDEFSKNPQATIFVCNYADAGNVRGVRPYSEGMACSSCAKETCQSSLCTDPSRDFIKSYDWSPGWDSNSASSGPPVSYWLASSGLHLLSGLCWILHFY